MNKNKYIIKIEHYDKDKNHVNTEFYTDYPDDSIYTDEPDFKEKFDKYVSRYTLKDAEKIIHKFYEDGNLKSYGWNGITMGYCQAFIKEISNDTSGYDAIY